MREIRMPKLNTNDTMYLLVEWLHQDGARLACGTPVAAVETSKAIEELAVEHDGVLQHVVAEGAECPVGGLIGYQFADEEQRQVFLRARADVQPADTAPTGVVITDPARELIEQHGVSTEAVRALGLGVVRRADVAALLSSDRGAASVGTSRDRRQRAIADVVTAAHRDIPAAFAVIKIYVDPALRLRELLGREEQVVVGLPELLVKAIGLADQEFCRFFADGGPRRRRDVGVTVDVGTGLFVPVIRAAADRSLAEIAELLMEYRTKAVRQAFREEDLRAGDIVLSLNNADAVMFAQPIVFPGHICALSLGGTIDELYRDEQGGVDSRSYVHLGVSYDHRVVNGRDSVAFLRGLKGLLEKPETLR